MVAVVRLPQKSTCNPGKDVVYYQSALR